MAEKIGIVIFGASGFTGKHTIPYVANLCKKHDLTWGIAGRSEEKLQSVLKEYETQIEQTIETVPIIIADTSNEKSILEMAEKSQVIINCCGPFGFHGEIVVKACIEKGTHHIDVSAEMQFMEEMALKYHTKAQETGTLIISACGVESVPVDLGMHFLEQNFEGTLNSVETYLKIINIPGFGTSSVFNYGTWESFIYILAHSNELKEIRKKMWPKPLPEFKPKLETKLFPRKVTDGWVVPLFVTDRSVVRRTQRHFYENSGKRPIQMESYLFLPSFFYILLLIIAFGILVVLTKFSFGRTLLLKYPAFWSFGAFSFKSPSEENAKNTKCAFTLIGKGWGNKIVADANDQYSTEPNRTIVAKINITNPGYGGTCLCLALSAATILKEKNKIPKGGVYTPGYAFANTSLIRELNDNGLTFSIEE